MGKSEVVQLNAKPVVTVESGIPLAKRSAKRQSVWADLPWLRMNVEDSFVFPGDKKHVSHAINHAKNKWPSRKHAWRALPDGTIRIWRTA